MWRFACRIARILGLPVVSRELLQRYKQGDFIPDGEEVVVGTLQFRHTHSHELFQCCEMTGYDVQSGPYYCGQLATVVAGNTRSYVGLCERHARGCRPQVRRATLNAKYSLLSV